MGLKHLTVGMVFNKFVNFLFGSKTSNQPKQAADSHIPSRSDHIVEQLMKNENC